MKTLNFLGIMLIKSHEILPGSYHDHLPINFSISLMIELYCLGCHENQRGVEVENQRRLGTSLSLPLIELPKPGFPISLWVIIIAKRYSRSLNSLCTC